MEAATAKLQRQWATLMMTRMQGKEHVPRTPTPRTHTEPLTQQHMTHPFPLYNGSGVANVWLRVMR